MKDWIARAIACTPRLLMAAGIAASGIAALGYTIDAEALPTVASIKYLRVTDGGGKNKLGELSSVGQGHANAVYFFNVTGADGNDFAPGSRVPLSYLRGVKRAV